MSKSMQVAEQFYAEAKQAGYDVLCNEEDQIVRIKKYFQPGDVGAFVQCDSEYYRIMSGLPVVTAGSMWGTTGDGVGGYCGTQKGYFEVSQSGISKRVIRAILKIQG